MPNLQGAVIGWSLIGVLFIITIFVVRWSAKVHKRVFDNEVRKVVQEELQKETAKQSTQDPRPGSQEHYENWKAERENRKP